MTENSEKGYFKGLTRQDYVSRAYKIMERDGYKNISIRRLASELGCSSAALYRHFSDKDELLYFVHLQTLERYIKRLSKGMETWANPWDIYVGVWDCYCTEAFSHIEAFDMLFFKNNNEILAQAFKEYYEMFPGAITHTSELFQTMLQSSDFMGRDYLMCQRAEEAGVISHDNAKRLNRAVCMLYKGYFKTVQDGVDDNHTPDFWTKLCIADIDLLVHSLASDLKGYTNYYNRNEPSVNIDPNML